MQDQFDEIINYFKSVILDNGVNALNRKKDQQAEASATKRVHVALADKLTQVTRLVDSCPGVIETVEKARFIVNNAPLGTRPAGKKILLKAVAALESVADKEPQIARPLKLLKPLVYEYLGMDNPSEK